VTPFSCRQGEPTTSPRCSPGRGKPHTPSTAKGVGRRPRLTMSEFPTAIATVSPEATVQWRYARGPFPYPLPKPAILIFVGDQDR
jgi:hypothetical protein